MDYETRGDTTGSGVGVRSAATRSGLWAEARPEPSLLWWLKRWPDLSLFVLSFIVAGSILALRDVPPMTREVTKVVVIAAVLAVVVRLCRRALYDERPEATERAPWFFAAGVAIAVAAGIFVPAESRSELELAVRRAGLPELQELFVPLDGYRYVRDPNLVVRTGAHLQETIERRRVAYDGRGVVTTDGARVGSVVVMRVPVIEVGWQYDYLTYFEESHGVTTEPVRVGGVTGYATSEADDVTVIFFDHRYIYQVSSSDRGRALDIADKLQVGNAFRR